MGHRVSSNRASFRLRSGMNSRVSPLLRSLCAPAMSLRVSPNSASSGCADGKFPASLKSSLLRLRRRWVIEFPRITHRSGCAGSKSAGYPASSLLCAPMMSLRVAPNPASSGCADGKFPSYPESSLPRLRQRSDRRVAPTFTLSGDAASASPGCPGSCICGWVDDDSPAGFELCILGLNRG
jgi:hypothetical protein